ncbi:hypothetical protein A374_08759 [Fictibacillus macauensis ZFHKF-1]|uniref:Phage gp6-like head-tail connector protein n=1 Tax=Fictibacillus macauensis ZFHKF-1 TaxID=1196324 RepID=I8UGF6_9BACL|nr:head-tail connector protein [Fictibacillus macauensis]EIT85913.1 hypothetical protein A374_08759 [Fictibacillus macauensis ZFHKF-1]
MPLNMDLLKKYLRIDGSEDDDILALLVESAKKDLMDSGVPEPVGGFVDQRYDLLIMLHVGMYYENRDSTVNVEKFNTMYQNLLLKLKSR